jgi:hypothetical protein
MYVTNLDRWCEEHADEWLPPNLEEGEAPKIQGGGFVGAAKEPKKPKVGGALARAQRDAGVKMNQSVESQPLRDAPDATTHSQPIRPASARPITSPTALSESEKTAALAVTPHPLGKPGGPGLWHHKGLMLPPYVQNVARGIMKSGRPKSMAIAAAIGTVKRWARGGGDVSPEVRAAAAKAVAEWTALKASHGGGAVKAAAKKAAGA